MNNHLKKLQKEVDKIEIKNDLEEVIIITKYIMELEEEIARLNKIIDELEKWVNMQIDFLKDLNAIPNAKNIINEHTTMILTYQNILDKLKKLKEEGKE